jgi:hypothetical protein
MKINRVHLLGTESFGNISVLCYFAATDMFDFISFDATSWRQYARFEYYLLNDLTTARIKEGFFNKVTFPVTCPCPSCAPFDTFGELRDLPYDVKLDLFSNHNFYVFEQFKEDCFRHALKGLAVFEDFLKSLAPTRTKEIDDIIRMINLVESVKDTITEDGIHAIWGSMFK